jgi:hypothetical protein
MHRVEVEVVLECGGGSMGLSRRLWLPFAPFAGLELYGLTAEPLRPEVVACVGWDVRENCFHVELQGRPGEGSLAELIDSYGPGWLLLEPGWVCAPDG